MCFSYFYHQTFRFTARNGIVSWTWGSWDSKGKETFFARGWEKNCPSAKKGHWRARTWHRFFRSDYGYMKKGRQTSTETVDCCITDLPWSTQNIPKHSCRLCLFQVPGTNWHSGLPDMQSLAEVPIPTMQPSSSSQSIGKAKPTKAAQKRPKIITI
jgi:hypothetical protein